MIFLKNDYSLGCHPAVLQALVDTNMELHDGYCEDDYCRKAADRIRQLVNCPEADVHYIPGGTLMNLTALAAFLLRPHWSVISADSGHICVHETGAIEATGHKINHVKTVDGKLRPEDIEDVLIFHEDEHYVLPKAIYISDSTETGLIYTKEELMALRACCNQHGLYIYLDGARLPMALSSKKNDVKFTEAMLKSYAQPLSDTENEKCKHAIREIRDALKELGPGRRQRRTEGRYALPYQTARRTSRKGQTDGRSVRCALGRRTVS